MFRSSPNVQSHLREGCFKIPLSIRRPQLCGESFAILSTLLTFTLRFRPRSSWDTAIGELCDLLSLGTQCIPLSRTGDGLVLSPSCCMGTFDNGATDTCHRFRNNGTVGGRSDGGPLGPHVPLDLSRTETWSGAKMGTGA